MPNPNLPINAQYNTYVGARYVPKFATPTEWDRNVQYEPLTIVVHEGNSFTSKTFVPVGVDINNDTYWAKTGNYNAQVEAYRKEVEAVKEGVETNASDITELQDNLNSDIKSLQTGCLYIGNSYTVGINNPGIYGNSKHIWDKSWMKTGSGVGFLPYSQHPNTFRTLLQNAITDTSIPNDEITHVIFISAMGDARARFENQSAFKSNLLSEFSLIQATLEANCPNIKRIMFVLAETRDVINFGDNPYYNLYDLNTEFGDVNGQHRFEYLGWIGWETLMRSALIQDDHYHPSTNGSVVLGTLLINAILGDFSESVRAYHYSITLPTAGEQKEWDIYLNMTPELLANLLSV